ncbi:MAG: hypothetical protein VST71_10360 [Nitrospirota bacterium]|nr:hypothetical protein [Nitrospirota bacterium]
MVPLQDYAESGYERIILTLSGWLGFDPHTPDRRRKRQAINTMDRLDCFDVIPVQFGTGNYHPLCRNGQRGACV